VFGDSLDIILIYCTKIALEVCSTHLKVSMDLVPGRSRGEDKVTYLENEVEWTETFHDCSMFHMIAYALLHEFQKSLL